MTNAERHNVARLWFATVAFLLSGYGTALAAAPPFAVAHADLAGVTTKYGIHIGSTVAQVEAVYGRTRLVQATGGEPVLSYVREIPVASKSGFRESPEGVETWFGIVNGRVASLSVGAGY